MIPITLLEKYNMKSLSEFKKDFGNYIDSEIGFYQTFLIQTDHIPNKIIEAQILNQSVNDYIEILELRQFARDEINKLKIVAEEGDS